MALAVVFALALLFTDTAGIRTLVTASGKPATDVAIMVIGSITTLVPLVLATALGFLR